MTTPAPARPTSDGASTEPALRVRGLGYTYPGSHRAAVDGMSFDVERGEVFGFLGPSGAGKSTTQKVLMRLLRRHEGTVEALGRPLASWRSDYYEHIGVSFELPNHYLKLTAAENLRFFASLYRGATRDPAELLTEVGLADDADRRVGEFSKGMQQRLTLARSLLNDPELLFLDEPTAGLDPGNARRVKDLVHRLRAEGRSVFLTTHDMVVADELCDRVAFVVDGRIVALDTPTALQRRRPDRQVVVESRHGDRVVTEAFPLAGIGVDAGFLDRLRGGGIESIRTDDATLEDVFIEVTGTSLVDGGSRRADDDADGPHAGEASR